jgi:DNA-binding Lrp family transcriptional regulator
MSSRAIVLVDTAVGMVSEVTSTLKELDEVTAVDGVLGPYDVIAIVESEDFDSIWYIVTAKINAVAGVSRTIVCAIQQ